MNSATDIPTALPTATAIPNDPSSHSAGGNGGPKPVVAFIIGLLIILAASLLNAIGLNLAKLDHARNAAIPKSARKRDWLRPLLVLGMLLYILSQLIGSTLALEYMRAEYVAPLGSSSLVFNFLFANLLVGTQITRTDIYGTVVVVVGVIGIVAFGSINSGLESGMDADRLHTLWTRSGWLLYFLATSLILIGLFISASQLEAILAARADVDAIPFAAESSSRRSPPASASILTRGRSAVSGAVTRWGLFLERRTAAQTDRNLAWTLGIAWACCGGGLAGGCLVFAKASVKLISGKLSHTNSGELGRPAAIFTFILLAVCAVSQIIALNKGLRAYDSTLVVPMFYGVYTASGFLNSLIFNNEVDAYKPWTLALVFLSILVLIGGVILLTNEKPDPIASSKAKSSIKMKKQPRTPGKSAGSGHDSEPLNTQDTEGPHGEPVWDIGADSDEDEDEDEDVKHHATHKASGSGSSSTTLQHIDDVRSPFINGEDEAAHDDGDDDENHEKDKIVDSFRDHVPPSSTTDEEFGDWEDGSKVLAENHTHR